jgi:hypothetical protein
MQPTREIPKAKKIKEEVEGSCLVSGKVTGMLPIVATLLPKMLPF